MSTLKIQILKVERFMFKYEKIIVLRSNLNTREDMLERTICVARKRGLVSEPADLLVVIAGFPFHAVGASNQISVVSARPPQNGVFDVCD
jgi:pyruvate kinase